MGDYQPRHASAANLHCTTGKPHHPRSATIPFTDALAFTRRMLSDAYDRLLAQGVDQITLDSSFSAAFAAAGEEPAAAGTVRPPVPDRPGADLHPDPGGAATVAEFLDCLRNYRIWAGSPSYRVMSRNCKRRFAPSTICTALGGESLPGLEMVLAIVSACGGTAQHKSEFATAWRRLTIPRQEAGKTAS